MAGLIPGIFRLGVPQQLYAAYSCYGPNQKVDQYCSAAELLYQQGCTYSAKLPLALARRAVYAIKADVPGRRVDAVRCLCKIAQLRSRFAPTVFPGELTEAASLEKSIPDKEKSLHYYLWWGTYRDMGKAYVAARDQIQAKTSFQCAREYAAMHYPGTMAADALCKIADEEKQTGDLKAATETLEIAFQKAWEGRCDGSYARVEKLVAISNLYVSINPKRAAEVLNLAEQAIKAFASSETMSIKDAKEMVKSARLSQETIKHI